MDWRQPRGCWISGFIFNLAPRASATSNTRPPRNIYAKVHQSRARFGEALKLPGLHAHRVFGQQLPRARTLIEKAVKLEPKNGAYLDSLGWVLYKLNQPALALPWMLSKPSNSARSRMRPSWTIWATFISRWDKPTRRLPRGKSRSRWTQRGMEQLDHYAGAAVGRPSIEREKRLSRAAILPSAVSVSENRTSFSNAQSGIATNARNDDLA